MTGTVQYAGRTFEYNYDAPTDSEIEARALDIQKDSQCTPEESKAAAKDELTRKNRNNAKRQAQRLVTDPDKLKGTAGVTEKTNSQAFIGGSNPTDEDKRVMTDDTVEAELKDLVGYLNSKQFAKRENRLASISGKGSNQGMDDADFRVDLEIPEPSAPRSPATGNPLGPQMHELAIRFGGGGDVNSQYLQEMKYINRYGKSFLPISRVLTLQLLNREPC